MSVKSCLAKALVMFSVTLRSATSASFSRSANQRQRYPRYISCHLNLPMIEVPTVRSTSNYVLRTPYTAVHCHRWPLLIEAIATSLTVTDWP